MRVALAQAVIVFALAACAPRGASHPSAQRGGSADAARLDEALDRLEERMLVDQARVRFWREMRDRHESVSAIACTNLDRHADGIALLEEKQREKRDALARKNRVAARFVPPADTASAAPRDER